MDMFNSHSCFIECQVLKYSVGDDRCGKSAIGSISSCCSCWF